MKGRKSYLVETIPVSKSASPKPLSYFASMKLVRGNMVRVPVRNTLTEAVVTSCRDVSKMKSEIRGASFQLKKIRTTDISNTTLPVGLLEAAEEVAKYYGTSAGTILYSIIPSILRNKLPRKSRRSDEVLARAKVSRKETLLLQMEISERFAQYRTLVRQSFARGSSAILVVPTHLDLEYARKELESGIAEFVYAFSPSASKREVEKTWREAHLETHPILFITTPGGIVLGREDVDTVIIERENSRAYRTMARPFFSLKKFIESYGHITGMQLVLGDSVVSVETLWREKRGEFSENSLIRWRLPGVSTQLVDARSGEKDNGKFEIFSPDLKELMDKAISQNERILLFGARKGLAPTTVCGDCGAILECSNCRSPLTLHQKDKTRFYLCHVCRTRHDTNVKCDYCKSWKLVPLGIGTEEIGRRAQELYPKKKVLILDKEHASTELRARKIVAEFEREGGILVGTEMAFFYLRSVPYGAVVSIDALFSIPDFSVNERIFYTVSHLREVVEKELVVQTRNIGQRVLSLASSGNIVDLYTSEIEERNSLLYPPFSIFIKIENKDTRHKIQDTKDRFAKWQPDVLKDSLVIRIPREKWPDEGLSRELSLLPPQFTVKVDPETILGG